MSEETEETEGWGWYLAKFGGKIILRTGMNIVVPGSGAALDFFEAVNDYRNGNKIGCAINIVSGIADIATLGIASGVKETVETSAKNSAVAVARTKAASEGGKKVGKELGKEISKGLVPEAASEVMFQSQKFTFSKLPEIAVTQFFSNGFTTKDFFLTTSEYVSAKTAEEFLAGFAKGSSKNMSPIFWKAATTGAEEELKKHGWKFVGKDYVVGIFKGVIKESGNSRDSSKPAEIFQKSATYLILKKISENNNNNNIYLYSMLPGESIGGSSPLSF